MPRLGPGWNRPGSRPLVLGHRGDSQHFPENTMLAFGAAMRAGADGVELDVRVCATGELVVFHDENLQRLCGDSRRVAQLSWRDLQASRIEGQGIPRLGEVFEELPDALVNVEIKTHSLALALPVVRATLAAIEGARAIDRVIVSSFDPRLLAILRVLDPQVPRALLSARPQGLVLRNAWLAAPLSVVAVHPQHDVVDERAVQHCQRRGLRIHTWTVDDADRIAYLHQIGVDALICNDPGAARRIVDPRAQ